MQDALFLSIGILGICLSWLFACWVIQIKTVNAGWADFGWAAGLVSAAFFCAIAGPGQCVRKFCVALMAGLWGIRLSWMLLKRLRSESLEDPRYLEIRKKWKTNLNFKFFVFFMTQGVVSVFLCVPFLVSVMNISPRLSGFEVAGFILWAVGFSGEALSDYQMGQFKKDPSNRGKVCDAGLWRYSRHPNYFFEIIIWCSYFVFALGSEGGGWAVIAPLLMAHFLINVSGIPLAEAQALRSKGEVYRQYQQTTSVLVPWRPKRGSSVYL